MPLRTARALRLFWRSLLDIKEGINTIMTKLDDLKAADAAEASAVADAVKFIQDLQLQHNDDVAKLAAALQNPGVDVSPIVAGMQTRAATLTSAIASLHATVTAAADPAATADTITSGAADSISGSGSATVSGADSVTGAGTDTVTAS